MLCPTAFIVRHAMKVVAWAGPPPVLVHSALIAADETRVSEIKEAKWRRCEPFAWEGGLPRQPRQARL